MLRQLIRLLLALLLILTIHSFVGCKHTSKSHGAQGHPQRNNDGVRNLVGDHFNLCGGRPKLHLALIDFNRDAKGDEGKWVVFGIEDLVAQALLEEGRFSLVVRGADTKPYNELFIILKELKLRMEEGLVDPDAVIKADIERRIKAISGRFEQDDRVPAYSDAVVKAVLHEIKISQEFEDEDLYLKTGKILGVDCMLFGSIRSQKNAHEIKVHMRDTETLQRLADAEVVARDLGRGFKKDLARKIARELTNQLPVATGKVVEVQDGHIEVLLDSEKFVKKGMKLVVFQLGEALLAQRTGEVICHKYENMGQATIERIDGRNTSAILREDVDGTKIRPNQFVVTQ